MKIRLDQLLVEKKLVRSRSQAHSLIKEKKVEVNSEIITKPSRGFDSDSIIKIKENTKFVSRGARKLEAAAKAFQINPQGLIIADVGASTGGFTDFLIQHGAKKSYAIDVGHDQLAEKLLNDPRVINMEGQNIRDLKNLPEPVDLAVVDLSYISLRLVLKTIIKLLKPEGEAILLFKPQFEGGPKAVNKQGIILEEKKRTELLKSFLEWCKKEKISIKKYISSPIKGKTGNIEYLLYIKNDRST